MSLHLSHCVYHPADHETDIFINMKGFSFPFFTIPFYFRLHPHFSRTDYLIKGIFHLNSSRPSCLYYFFFFAVLFTPLLFFFSFCWLAPRLQCGIRAVELYSAKANRELIWPTFIYVISQEGADLYTILSGRRRGKRSFEFTTYLYIRLPSSLPHPPITFLVILRSSRLAYPFAFLFFFMLYFFLFRLFLLSPRCPFLPPFPYVLYSNILVAKDDILVAKENSIFILRHEIEAMKLLIKKVQINGSILSTKTEFHIQSYN